MCSKTIRAVSELLETHEKWIIRKIINYVIKVNEIAMIISDYAHEIGVCGFVEEFWKKNSCHEPDVVIGEYR
jgi:hypothetical protein